ncbi:helix-turn-helix transcriptional regulator [Halomonas nitroreducens]|uniref:Response regulator transcription factor n=1 Tax=Halomonas nitroreducens TaxID=447425 RepID=A0A431V0R8_9GAMM|nr:response regulator transcription factor [Halomonas nitroreducens]RTQ99642.1 response regulator transcription factor [Halomonas nitroreducens]
MTVHDYLLVISRTRSDIADLDYLEQLKHRGYTVECLPPGQDAVEVLTSRPPFVACFHYDYPDQQGLGDLRRAKQAARSVPLLMITHAHSEELAIWAFRSRVWDYFAEPLDLQRFMDVVKTLHDLRLGTTITEMALSPLEHSNRMPRDARLHYEAPSTQEAKLKQALDFIEQHLDGRFSQADVAACCGLSVFQLSRLFKRNTGYTFQDYLLKRRIEEAVRLLANPTVTITDICFAVGFRDLSYFTRTFHRQMGQSPSAYRCSVTDKTSPLPSSCPSSPTTVSEQPERSVK